VRRLFWVVFILAAAAAIATVAVPTLYIQPFKPQAAAGLARAYALRQAAPAITAVCLPLVLVSAAALVWLGTLRPKRSTEVPSHVGQDFSPARQRSTKVLRHTVRYLPPVVRGLTIVVLVGLTGLVTWFCRQNHFEWMFAPPAEVKYVSAKDASAFLTPDEMVMGIEVGGLSLAYPIRQMAYHHVVNDMFGTTPVVVTY
jgi:hypothetical protein